ncbi:hypothetical protein K501DRAFT_165105, partial [Backusella circina FSU 941]
DDNRVKLTSILKSGHGSDSVLLDITGRRETTTSLLRLITQQYPSRRGVLLRRDRVNTFAEINFKAILEKGVTFDDQSVVIPCMAL